MTLQRAGEAAVTVRAVFDEREVEIEFPDGDGIVRETQIFIFGSHADLGSATVGDIITARGATWRCVDFLPDGENAVEVQLSRIDQNTDC